VCVCVCVCVCVRARARFLRKASSSGENVLVPTASTSARVLYQEPFACIIMTICTLATYGLMVGVVEIVATNIEVARHRVVVEVVVDLAPNHQGPLAAIRRSIPCVAVLVQRRRLAPHGLREDQPVSE
jgi:hypothetical protein